MGLTSSLFIALSGLNVNQLKLDVTGNNIANANTTAFKATRLSFESQFSQTFSLGAPPSDVSGGTNPSQIGLGAAPGMMLRDMSPGAFETTGKSTDLAIGGKGWFVLQQGDGSQAYTRDGAFTLNADNYLVNGNGNYLMGYGVDDQFNVVPGAVDKLEVPLDQLTVAQATGEATLIGALNSSGAAATTGSRLSSQTLYDAGVAATGASLLTDIRSAAVGGTALFTVGDKLTLNVSKGGRDLPPSTFTVTAAATTGANSGGTLTEVAEWLSAALGIDTTAGLTPTPGVSVVAGQLAVVGNVGTVNDLDISAGDLLSNNAAVNQPLAFTKAASADGESAQTSMLLYDSLGTKIQANVSLVMTDKTAVGTTWQWFAQSADDTDGNLAVGAGTLTFNTAGQLLTGATTTISIDRTATGAGTPLDVTLNFDGMNALAGDRSAIAMTSQDGYPTGLLSDFAIGDDGRITGTFTNGLTRTLGQVTLAVFANDSGLVADNGNLFEVGPNSGDAVIGAANSGGAGKIASGALELSNVDLSQEFVNLILASTGFSAASRVISSSNQLLNDLLQTVR